MRSGRRRPASCLREHPKRSRPAPSYAYGKACRAERVSYVSACVSCVCVCVCVCVVGVRCALLRCVGVGVCCCVHAVYLLCVLTVPLGVCNLSSRRSIRTQHCMPASIS